MSRIQLARKLARFLVLNRIAANKRTKAQKEQHAALDEQLSTDLDAVFKSVNVKPPQLDEEDTEADADVE